MVEIIYKLPVVKIKLHSSQHIFHTHTHTHTHTHLETLINQNNFIIYADLDYLSQLPGCYLWMFSVSLQ